MQSEILDTPMEEDLIVVDDEPMPISQPPQLTALTDTSDSESVRPKTIAAHVASTSRLRSSSRTPAATQESSDRTTRSAAAKAKPQPKLKLKLGDKLAAQAPGMSFLGQYDRELDSDDEDLAFEEQFILRMPPGEDCEKLRKMVAAREVSNDVWFKFKDSRRAVFHIGNNTYSSKLVDLPCIIESQKTLDNKQMFKVADICQMLVVENRVDQDEPSGHKNFNIEEFIWPHGITPPLHHVRKRRFRKRVNRRTIESVEQAVERLLDEDAIATQVKYDILENVNPDLSDSEFIEREEPIDAPTPAISDGGEVAGGDAPEGDEDSEESDEPDGEIDEELAAELDLALGDGDDDGDDEEEEDESEEEDEDDDDDEATQSMKLLNEEIRDLEAAVAKKENEIAGSANILIKKRFEDALKKLTADLEMKRQQKDGLKERQRMEQEGITAEPVNADEEPPAEDEGDDGDLFGDAEMDLS
ncbi:transcription initiation factor TFIID subunit 7 [Favolaschia claudopus]|uniref:Transcription initiation factor TFIID subunit 7 n=1 Tax=Favolaschia claudopus TaxID=2862362 RepID=A0AAW0B377_9AGAR